MSEAAASPAPPARWSLYGDLPWRLLLGGVRACPSWIETPSIAGWSFLIFLLASMPAGLVLYWTWSNVLSILQQWVIMRKHGKPTALAAKV